MEIISADGCRIIDYGTSEWEETEKSIGVQRDIKYIFNNTRVYSLDIQLRSFLITTSL